MAQVNSITRTWSIGRKPIPAPTLEITEYEYNGSTIVPTWQGYSSSEIDISGDVQANKAGTFKTIFTPNKNHCWENGSVTPVQIEWTVTGSTQLTAQPVQRGSLTFNGATQTPEWDNYDPAAFTVSGTISATNAGSYLATFTPNEGYEWDDGTIEPRDIEWTIGRLAVALPSQIGALEYTGESLSPEWEEYDEASLTITGATEGTTAGDYEAMFTPGSNWCWEDGTFDGKTVTWTIAKAMPELSVSPTALNFASTGANAAQTITVTTPSTGAISATSDKTNIATTKVDGKKVSVTPVAVGSATISIGTAADVNYLASLIKQCTATITDGRNISASAFKSLLSSGQGPNSYSPGDSIGIGLSGTVGRLALSGTYYPQILGFKHNSGVEGTTGNYVDIQWATNADGTPIAFCDDKWNTNYTDAGVDFRMNTTSTNTGGYAGSQMAKSTCPAFLNLIASDWRTMIVDTKKYTDNTGGGSDTASYVTAGTYKIWLLAEFEIFGARTYSNSAEQNYQKQYPMYANGASRVRYKHNEPTTTTWWWERSPLSTDASIFCRVSAGGNPGANCANNSYGFAPGSRLAA